MLHRLAHRVPTYNNVVRAEGILEEALLLTPNKHLRHTFPIQTSYALAEARMKSAPISLLLICLAGSLAGCEGVVESSADSGVTPPRPEAGVEAGADSGSGPSPGDAGWAPGDAGSGLRDGGSGLRDAGSGSAPAPAAEHLPTIFGRCPTFMGDGADVTFQTSRGDRPVRMWISEAAETLDGPLVLYWHGWHGSPGLSGITSSALRQLLDMGGIFVAPYIDPDAPSNYWTSWDLITADQVVACAIATVGIDQRRIHSIGYSAGGMQTYRMIHERSGYLASAVMYSPGTNGSPGMRQERENLIATMITWGDAEDMIYQTLAEQYFARLTGYGFFSIMCHHTGGHIQPSGVRDRALDFLLAHPFGTNPSPFVHELPDNYPDYCTPSE